VVSVAKRIAEGGGLQLLATYALTAMMSDVSNLYPFDADVAQGVEDVAAMTRDVGRVSRDKDFVEHMQSMLVPTVSAEYTCESLAKLGKYMKGVVLSHFPEDSRAQLSMLFTHLIRLVLNHSRGDAEGDHRDQMNAAISVLGQDMALGDKLAVALRKILLKVRSLTKAQDALVDISALLGTEDCDLERSAGNDQLLATFLSLLLQLETAIKLPRQRRRMRSALNLLIDREASRCVYQRGRTIPRRPWHIDREETQRKQRSECEGASKTRWRPQGRERLRGVREAAKQTQGCHVHDIARGQDAPPRRDRGELEEIDRAVANGRLLGLHGN
jgi:hypothetical protein